MSYKNALPKRSMTLYEYDKRFAEFPLNRRHFCGEFSMLNSVDSQCRCFTIRNTLDTLDLPKSVEKIIFQSKRVLRASSWKVSHFQLFESRTLSWDSITFQVGNSKPCKFKQSLWNPQSVYDFKISPTFFTQKFKTSSCFIVRLRFSELLP